MGKAVEKEINKFNRHKLQKIVIVKFIKYRENLKFIRVKSKRTYYC